MRTSFQILVVGDVPEARKLPENEQFLELTVDQVMSADEFDEALADDNYALAVTAAQPFDSLCGADVVSTLKQRSPYRPVIMVADPDQADDVLDGRRNGLDEHLIRCKGLGALAKLLSWSVRRCLEDFTPGATTIGSRFHVALRQATFSNVQEALVLIDCSGHIFYYNQAANELSRQIFGTEIAVGEHFAEHLDERFDEALGEQIRDYVREALRGDEVLIRVELPSPEAPEFVREFRYAPVTDHHGRIIAVSVTNRDLHDVLAVEEKLEESESRFWEFFENLPVGIGIINREGSWVQVNPVVEDLLGYSSEELIGTNPLDYIHPDDVERSEKELTAVVSGKAKMLKHQKHMIHRDGHEIWTDITAMAIGGDDAPPELFIGIITDVTRRRQLEDQLQETEKMRMIGQLAGGVAHDFNNLLTIITSYTHYAINEFDEASPQAIALNKVIQAAYRGSSLTDQLLAFSRRQLSRPKTFDLSGVVNDTCEMLDRLLRPAVELEVDLGDTSVPIWIDRAQIEQILFNLVINARDAMPEGGQLVLQTRLEKFSEPQDVHVECIPAGDWGVLEVRDSGHGIDPEIIKHIFEPFFTTKKVGEGTGLGLASTWGIVKQAGGYIDVDSSVGQGTRFTLYFPKSSEQPEEQPDEQPGAAKPTKTSATVLLVEDDPEVRKALRCFLDRQGFHVLEASSGTDALDILLTDVIMPGMSGNQLAETISDEHPETHIFLMTGFAGGRFQAPDKRWEVLSKPLDLDDLAGKLDEALN
jgi:PAS domain S-box-containing protein